MANRRSVMSTSAEPPSSSNNDPLRELFEACKTGDIVRVKKLVNPQTVNARDTAGRKSTPLHFAAGYGRRDVVEFLLATGASIQARDDGGLHPLHNACSFGHADVVRLLLEAGANPNTRDNWNYTPLHEAAIKGKVDVCIALLQHGGDANIRNTEGKTALELSDSAARPVLTGDHRKEELLEAARSGAEDRLVALLNPLNVNCHASDGRRSTPLHLAAGYNRNRVVQLLLQHGADVHAKDKGGLVPLHNACSYGHFEVTEMLIKHGANVNAMDLWQFTPLHEAASKSRVEVCSLLLSEGADPTLLNCHSKSAIDVAPTRELQERLAYEFKGHCLLEASRQADPTKVKKYLTPDVVNFKHPYTGDTPLVRIANLLKNKQAAPPTLSTAWAAQQSMLSKPFVTSTPLYSAPMTTPLSFGSLGGHYRFRFTTPIGSSLFSLGQGQATHCASSSPYLKRKQVLETIIRKGAHLNEKNKEMLTPLHVASDNSHSDAMDVLLRHGAKVNALDGLGQTALHRCAREDNLQACRILLSYNVDTTIISLQGYTAVQVATETVLKILQDPPSGSADVECQLLEAAKAGDSDQVQRLLTTYPQIVNCRDLDGR
uniref:(California timema) hypothetical protein n=1 Tax=Timema californicum TaxID=61474 RepID=A0A7R9JDM5_TIMCA|nr:unnamed protein product [Timema californicum]